MKIKWLATIISLLFSTAPLFAINNHDCGGWSCDQACKDALHDSEPGGPGNGCINAAPGISAVAGFCETDYGWMGEHSVSCYFATGCNVTGTMRCGGQLRTFNLDCNHTERGLPSVSANSGDILCYYDDGTWQSVTCGSGGRLLYVDVN